MALFSKKFLWFWFILFAVLFSAQIIPRIFQESPTNDEPIDLTNGYFYWQGDVVTNNHHPPLPKMLQALPLRFMNLNHSIPSELTDISTRAFDFFFKLNNDRVEAMVQAGRFVSLLFGLGIGFVLFLCVREKNFILGFSTLFLWAFNPTFLAYSGLCLADLPSAFFFFLSVLFFQRHLEKPGFPWALAAGAATGLAVCAKFSCLALIPLFIVLEVVNTLNRTSPHLTGVKRAQDWFCGAAGFLAAIGAIYLPGTLLLPEHHQPWLYFLDGLRNMAEYSRLHQATYFWGLASREDHWLYFPVVFFFKNTLPFLLLLLAALTAGLRKEQRFPFWMWFSPLFFFACILPVQNFGVRYLLPAFPFFVLIAGETAGALWEGRASWLKKGYGRYIVIALLSWNLISVLLNAPNMIGYCNDLIRPKDKSHYLADNNLDIGQEVKKLAQVAQQRHWEHIKLAQFGGPVNISFYGVPVEPWTEKDLAGPQPGFVYVMNITLFQIGPLFWPQLLPITHCWVIHQPPTGRVGDAWVYFEIPGKTPKDLSPRINSIINF